MDRARGNVQVYASEQAIRELYLKPFEICTKTAEYELKYYDVAAGATKTVTRKATGAYMTSMTFVGPMFTGNSYALLTTLLREEWGFEGFVITDFTSGTNKHKDRGYRVGNDLWLGMRTTELNNLDTATAQWAIRRAVHNIAYVYVNSNAYQGVAPGARVYFDMSPWKITLIAVSVVAGVLVLAGAVWVVLRALDEKKKPDKYKRG
jgi:beta-glucosidase